MSDLKIEKGDKLHLEVTVTGSSVHPDNVFVDHENINGSSTSFRVNINSPSIVKHIPKPPEPLKVGDRVRTPMFGTPGEIGTILSLYEDRAWVKWSRLIVPTSPLVSNLVRVG